MSVAEDILKAAKEIEKLDNLKESIYEAAQTKARLERNIAILKKANAEGQTKHEKDKKERQEQATRLENNIKVLEATRANLASSTIPEIDRLEALKIDLNKTRVALEKRGSDLDVKSETLRKRENTFEDKKNILAQIVELTGKI